MIRNSSFVLGLVCALAVPLVARGDAEPYNCREAAKPIVSSSDAREVTLVREWSNSIQNPLFGELITTSGWLDGQSGLEGQTNYWGVCWLSTTVEKGKDYVLWLDAGSTGSILLTAEGGAEVSSMQIAFASRTVDGITYYYIDAESWQLYHTDTTFYIRILGGPNTVGRTASVNFRQTALDAVVPHDKGSASDPYDIDVTQAGSVGLSTPPEEQRGRLATVYRAALKAGRTYGFEVSYPAANMGGAILMLPQGMTAADVPGTIRIVGQDVDMPSQAWTVTVTNDYSLLLAVGMWPTEDGAQKLDVTGARLSWQLDGETPVDPDPPGPQPAIVGSGSYSGTLVARTLADCTDTTGLAVRVTASVLDTAVTNFNSVLTIGTSELDCTDLRDGAVVQGEEPWQSCLEMRLVDGGHALSVYGAVYIDGTEYLVDGTIFGRVDGEDRPLAEVDAQTMSAEAMGITNGAFKTEAAGSEALVRLQQWGAKYDLTVSCANAVEFSASGGPAPGNLTAKAYLFDCALSEEAIEEAETNFVITAFDPVRGPVVKGDKTAGERYGNGRIEVRSSTTLGGTYDTATKADARQMFYRVYLVK